MNLGDKVKIKDIDKVKKDATLDPESRAILQGVNYQGIITDQHDDIYFVGFANDLGWITQGYKDTEIEVI